MHTFYEIKETTSDYYSFISFDHSLWFYHMFSLYYICFVQMDIYVLALWYITQIQCLFNLCMNISLCIKISIRNLTKILRKNRVATSICKYYICLKEISFLRFIDFKISMEIINKAGELKFWKCHDLWICSKVTL